MSKIFEEALADAKKLKSVAEENAKKAIIESVTPTIREYIEEQLLSEAKIDEDIEITEEADIDDKTLKELAIMLGADDIAEALLLSTKNNLNIAKTSAFKKLNENQQKKLLNTVNKLKKVGKNQKKQISNNVNFTEKNQMSQEKYYEVDLKMLREAVNDAAEEDKLAKEMADDQLKAEMAGTDLQELEEMYGDYNEADYNEEDENEAMLYEQEEESEDLDADMEAGAPLGGDSIPKSQIEAEIQELIADLGLEIGEAAGEEEGEPLDMDMELEPADEESEEEVEQLDEVFDIDPKILRQELRKIKSMMNEGNVDHNFGGKGSGKTNHSNAFGGPGPKKHGYQKSFGGGTEGKDVFVNPPATLKKLNEARKALQKLSRMNRSQNEKLNKYRSAVQTLREQLEDLNLFNAKLLYVNKLLQSKGLNESQKRSIIKALDEARSLGETKALYRSLTESLKSENKKSLNESVKYGSSSRATSSASSKTEASVGNSDRWQKLAGLK